MKILGIILSLVLAFNMQTEESGDLKVRLKNYPSSEGTMMIGVFDEKGFLNKPVKGEAVKVEGKESVTVTFKNLPYGEYAVSVLHDKNGNQQMDFDQRGMPLEDWAMSGTNPQDQRPQWELAKFSFDKDGQEVDISF